MKKLSTFKTQTEKKKSNMNVIIKISITYSHRVYIAHSI